MMLDELIEQHVRERLSAVYPQIEPAQVLVQFPTATLQAPRDQRGSSIGGEVLTVQVVIVDPQKLDRVLFIREIPRVMMNLGPYKVEQKFISTQQKDWIEIIKNKGVIFTLQYIYDL